jgi:AcrR family transcriptional regulator
MTASQLPPNKHQERSRRTRALLLDAAIESLAEVGYVNASTSDIAARAGVTRGAHLHHFRTRTELFAQAIDHLDERQREATRRVATALPSGVSPSDVLVDLIAAAFAGRLGKASVELFVAIRTDDELRGRMVRAQRGLTHDLLQICVEMIGPEVGREALESAFWMTLNLVRGTIVDEMLGRDSRRRKQILADWKRLAAAALS